MQTDNKLIAGLIIAALVIFLLGTFCGVMIGLLLFKA